MTIRRGEPWGSPGPLAAGAPVATSDAEVAEHLQLHWSRDGEPLEVGVLGGDLHATLGGPDHDELDLRSGRAMRMPMDLGTVRVDGGAPRVFVAHLIATARAGHRLWSSRTITVLNGSFVGSDNLGPRAHPNAARLDIYEGVLPRGQRRTGRRRARTGTHVPHPGITERRTAHHVVEADAPLHLRIDGRLAGSGTRLEITCHPDAWIAVV